MGGIWTLYEFFSLSLGKEFDDVEGGDSAGQLGRHVSRELFRIQFASQVLDKTDGGIHMGAAEGTAEKDDKGECSADSKGVCRHDDRQNKKKGSKEFCEE